MIIALDTSTETASLAIVSDAGILAEFTWRSGQNHTVQLLPSLKILLDRLNLDIESAKGIVVALGPGSFNGLRVGVSAAKGLAFSLGIPIAGVSTLEADAYQHAERGLPVCPVYNAGRGEMAIALYRKTGEGWRQFTPEHIATLEELVAETAGETLFCGEHVPVVAEELKARLGERAVIAPSPTLLRRAGFLAALGGKRLAEGDSDNVSALQPIYLRRPSITMPRPRPRPRPWQNLKGV